MNTKRLNGSKPMTFTARLMLLRFEGCTDLGNGEHLFQFTDALTGSTFSIQPGETIGAGLAAFILRWDTALSRETP